MVLQQWAPEVVASIQFVKIKTFFFAKPLGFQPRLTGLLSDIQSYALYWTITCEQLFD